LPTLPTHSIPTLARGNENKPTGVRKVAVYGGQGLGNKVFVKWLFIVHTYMNTTISNPAY